VDFNRIHLFLNNQEVEDDLLITSSGCVMHRCRLFHVLPESNNMHSWAGVNFVHASQMLASVDPAQHSYYIHVQVGCHGHVAGMLVAFS